MVDVACDVHGRTLDDRARRGEEPGLERNEVVATFEGEEDTTLRRFIGHLAKLASHPSECIRREGHLRERVAGGCVKTRADDDELGCVLVERRDDDALEGSTIDAVAAARRHR